MKQNPHKFPELLEKQNEETQPSENQMNLPYLLKKRKDPEPLPNKEVIKQQKIKDEEEKNKKTTKSLRFRHYKEFVFLYRHKIQPKYRTSEVSSQSESDQGPYQNHHQSKHGHVHVHVQFPTKFKQHAFIFDHQ